MHVFIRQWVVNLSNNKVSVNMHAMHTIYLRQLCTKSTIFNCLEVKPSRSINYQFHYLPAAWPCNSRRKVTGLLPTPMSMVSGRIWTPKALLIGCLTGEELPPPPLHIPSSHIMPLTSQAHCMSAHKVWNLKFDWQVTVPNSNFQTPQLQQWSCDQQQTDRSIGIWCLYVSLFCND